jgi:hypothetical protein
LQDRMATGSVKIRDRARSVKRKILQIGKVLQRRSRYRGYDAVAAGIGLGIFAHNVRRWAQRRAA